MCFTNKDLAEASNVKIEYYVGTLLNLYLFITFALPNNPLIQANANNPLIQANANKLIQLLFYDLIQANANKLIQLLLAAFLNPTQRMAI